MIFKGSSANVLAVPTGFLTSVGKFLANLVQQKALLGQRSSAFREVFAKNFPTIVRKPLGTVIMLFDSSLLGSSYVRTEYRYSGSGLW